jgi:hypothetical protein
MPTTLTALCRDSLMVAFVGALQHVFVKGRKGWTFATCAAHDEILLQLRWPLKGGVLYVRRHAGQRDAVSALRAGRKEP